MEVEEWLCEIFSLFIAWNLSTLLRVTQAKADDLNLINSSVLIFLFIEHFICFYDVY